MLSLVCTAVSGCVLLSRVIKVLPTVSKDVNIVMHIITFFMQRSFCQDTRKSFLCSHEAPTGRLKLVLFCSKHVSFPVLHSTIGYVADLIFHLRAFKVK